MTNLRIGLRLAIGCGLALLAMAFIAGGAGHMIGKGGVPALLKTKGFKVDRY